MNISVPTGSLFGLARRAITYFRSGVAGEGRAWFCTQPHPAILFGRGDHFVRTPSVPQHIEVDLSLWNRRGGRVTVIDVAKIDLPWRSQELAVAPFLPFESATLEEGGPQQTRHFALVPRGKPKERVEAAMGDPLVLEFRPSRGSERWARPRIRLTLGPEPES
jgi:hypothetical protein